MFYPEKQICIKGVYGLILSKKTPEFRFEGESHPFWEMVYVREGRVGVSADERIYSLSSGDIMLHKPMEFHRIWSEEGEFPRFDVITFEADGPLVKELEELTLKLDEADMILLERCVDVGIKAFKFNIGRVITDVIDEKLGQSYCNSLESFLLSIVSRKSPEKLPIESSRNSRMFSDIVLYLRDNIDKKLCVEQIAERFFVSPSKIKNLFTKYSGMGVISYFSNMKILEAQKLLREGFTVSETAERLGFANQFYFSSVFKKNTRLSPMDFKRAENTKKQEKM